MHWLTIPSSRESGDAHATDLTAYWAAMATRRSRSGKVSVPFRMVPSLAKRNTEHGSGLGKFRYVVEACFDWLFNWRRLRVRYEKRPDIHDAFLFLGCAMICWNRVMGNC